MLTIPPPPDAVLVELGPLTVRYYGVLIAVGVVLAIVLTRRRYAAAGGDPDLVERVALWGVLAGLVGARLGWTSTNLEQITADPLSVFAIWEGGLAFFGGLTLGVIAALLVLRRSGASLPRFADAAAPAIPLAQAVGRWGNYFNEELFGTPTDLPWALELGGVRGVYEPGTTVHPAFLYESVANLVLVGLIIWLGRRGWVRTGGLIFVYAIGYGALRFAIEQLRIDSNWEPFGMAINAWVALAVFLAGVVALVWWQRRGPGPARPATAGSGAGRARGDAGSGDRTGDAADARVAGSRADGAGEAESSGDPTSAGDDTG